MATLARPPLTQGPQPKRPIAPAEQGARARWLLDLLPPPGQSTIASAPWRKSQVFDLGLNRPLTLGINPNAVILQLTDSAPRRKPQLSLDSYTNLLTTTLAAQAPFALPLTASRVIESAPPRGKWIGDPESSQGFIVYDGPDATILSNTGSAPPPKRAAYAWDYPNLTVTTLTPPAPLDLPLLAVRSDWSAPQLKRPVVFDHSPNVIIRLPVPQILRQESREQRKYQIQLDVYPNLLSSVLAPQIPPVFSGNIPNISQNQNTGQYNYNLATYFSGATSYSIAPALEPGWSFDVGTAILSIDTDAVGVFGTFTVTATNANGSTPSNAFSVEVDAVAVSVDAGRPRHRRMYVEIGGETFWVRSAQEAHDLLKRARELAKQAAEIEAKRRLASNNPLEQIRATPKAAPRFKGPPELREQLRSAEKDIRQVYEKTAQDFETQYLMRRVIDEQDDEDLTFFM